MYKVRQHHWVKSVRGREPLRKARLSAAQWLTPRVPAQGRKASQEDERLEARGTQAANLET